MSKSFYTLEIFVAPGGARMSWHFVLNDWQQVQKALESYFEHDETHLSMYLLLWYGTDIIVQTYQNGERTQRIDMLPFIKVKIHGFKAFQAIGWSDLTELQVESSEKRISKPDEGELFWDSKNNRMGWDWDVLIDWENVPIETLTGNILNEDAERVNIYDNYFKQEVRVSYGVYEQEAGRYKRHLDWSNLWEIFDSKDDPGWDEVDEQRLQSDKKKKLLEEQAKERERKVFVKQFKELMRQSDEYSKEGQYEKAIQAIDELLKMKNDNVLFYNWHTLLNNRAYYRHRSGQNDVALQEINDLLEEVPVFSLAHHTKSEILFALERYAEALTNIDRSIELKPSIDKQEFRKEILQAMNQ